MRREADDPLRGRGERHRRTRIVGDAHRGVRDRSRGQRGGHRQGTSEAHGRQRSPANSVAPPVEKSAASW